MTPTTPETASDSPIVRRRPDRWSTRDYPVLLAVADKFDETDVIRSDRVSVQGLNDVDVQEAMSRLVRTDYLDGRIHGTMGGLTLVIAHAITEKGLRACQEWPVPDSGLQPLIDALNAQARATTDEDEKSRIRRAVEGLGSVSLNVAVEVAKAYAVHLAGLS